MPDIYLHAPNAATMHYAMRATYEALTGKELGPDEPTPSQANFAAGGSWVVDDIGDFPGRTGHHIILRWNSGEPVPDPGPLTVVWRSDDTDESGNPLSPPAWWTRVLA